MPQGCSNEYAWVTYVFMQKSEKYLPDTGYYLELWTDSLIFGMTVLGRKMIKYTTVQTKMFLHQHIVGTPWNHLTEVFLSTQKI